MSDAVQNPFTWRQKLFLSIGVPLMCLSFLEVTCRVLGLPKLSGNRPLKLEMPTWMLQDENTARKMSALSTNQQTVDWLSIFVAGDGYRVHLIPNTERRITNTFSLIKADRAAKYLVKANSLGFRGPELTPQKPSDTFRILVFGDSSSFGWGVDQDDTFSSLLKGRLERLLGKSVEIGNFAIPGDSSAYGRLVFERYAKDYEYDLAIFGFGANDAKRVLTSHTSQVEKFRSKKALLSAMSLLNESAFVRTIQTSIAPKPNSSEEVKRVPAVSEWEFSTNLRSMIDESRKGSDRQVMVLSLCTPGNYARRARVTAKDTGAIFFNGQRYLVNNIPAIQNGHHYPNLVSEMKNSYERELERNKLFYVTSDGCHPNKLGHALIADEMAQRINKAYAAAIH